MLTPMWGFVCLLLRLYVKYVRSCTFWWELFAKLFLSVGAKLLEKPAVLTHFQIKISAWDQSDKFVKIYFTSLDGAKEVDASNFELNLTGNKLFFKVSNLKGKNWMFEIKELSSNIDHEKSYYKAKSGMYV